MKMGALTICLEVRFKNNGLDLIEVQDNGSGISPDNYENVGEYFLEAQMNNQPRTCHVQ